VPTPGNLQGIKDISREAIPARVMVMGNNPRLTDIKEELRKVKDELTSLEEKIRKRQYREAHRQVIFIINDLNKVIDMVEEYEALNNNEIN
jgi:methionyl-tRNA synthetase